MENAWAGPESGCAMVTNSRSPIAVRATTNPAKSQTVKSLASHLEREALQQDLEEQVKTIIDLIGSYRLVSDLI